MPHKRSRHAKKKEDCSSACEPRKECKLKKSCKSSSSSSSSKHSDKCRPCEEKPIRCRPNIAHNFNVGKCSLETHLVDAATGITVGRLLVANTKDEDFLVLNFSLDNGSLIDTILLDVASSCEDLKAVSGRAINPAAFPHSIAFTAPASERSTSCYTFAVPTPHPRRSRKIYIAVFIAYTPLLSSFSGRKMFAMAGNLNFDVHYLVGTGKVALPFSRIFQYELRRGDPERDRCRRPKCEDECKSPSRKKEHDKCRTERDECDPCDRRLSSSCHFASVKVGENKLVPTP